MLNYKRRRRELLVPSLSMGMKMLFIENATDRETGGETGGRTRERRRDLTATEWKNNVTLRV
jgi:hypothetical protein